MSALNAQQICKVIYDFLRTENNPALFAGAGIGARAGLPTWSQLMEHLADVASGYEPLAGQLILQRARAGHYLEAVAAYKSCPAIPRGELYEQLSTPFLSPHASEKLRALICLPFRAIFTTNYDRSLHNAFASVTGRSAMTVELDDRTMDRAPFLTDFYIARIHGRAELPETIVVGKDDYQLIRERDCYIDFVKHALTRYSCLFLGFSFRDPAINHVFEVIEDRLSPGFPRLHLAVLPQDAEKALEARLACFNIETVHYDPSREHHALWKGITLVSRKYDKSQKVDKPKASFALDTIERFLATSYARKKLETNLQPLRDIVVDGIVMSVLEAGGGDGISFGQVTDALQEYLAIPSRDISRVIQRRIEVLSGRGWCRVIDDTIQLTRREWNELENDLDLLVGGVLNRFQVREGHPISSAVRVVAKQSVEETLVGRGWDLGAHYAGAMEGELPNIMSTISSAVEKHGPHLPAPDRKRLSRACYDLFHRPDEPESTVLGELGRVAFGLNLVISSPCATVTHRAILPERIYLDANVLMPAIVKGHPYRRLYADAIDRLADAARTSNMSLGVFATEGFLNEIISHRKKGQEEMRSVYLERPGVLTRHMLYQSAEHANVFVGAYGSQMEESREEVSFQDFLEEVAPYESEEQLSEYLQDRGIGTVPTYFRDDKDVFLYQEIRLALEKGYEPDNQFDSQEKADVLIEHEARQLTLLKRDLDQGLRSVFVTGDLGLRKVIADSSFRKLDSAIIPRRGLIQLIDLLVGLRSDPRSLTRLFWGGGPADEATLVRDYYTNRALEYRDEAMTASMPQVLDTLVPEVTEAAEREHVSLSPGGSAENKARQVRLLDRFEDRFYANMAEVVRRRFPDQYNLAEDIRRRQLRNHIQETLNLIGKYETQERESDDPKEQARCRRNLAELRGYLEEYERELQEIQEE